MDKKTKKENLDLLVGKLSGLKSVVFTNFKGLSAQDMSNMRSLMREKGGEYKVVKNTIALMAIKQRGKEDAQQFVSGPCAIAFLPEDPVGPMKILINFSKEHEAFLLKGGIIEGDIVDIEKLRKLAALPSRNELLTSVVRDLQAPISNLVSYLNQIILGLVCVVNSIKNKPAQTNSLEVGVQDGGSKDDKEGSR